MKHTAIPFVTTECIMIFAFKIMIFIICTAPITQKVFAILLVVVIEI